MRRMDTGEQRVLDSSLLRQLIRQSQYEKVAHQTAIRELDATIALYARCLKRLEGR